MGGERMAKVNASDLRKDIVKQLADKGADNKYYLDLVDQYLFFWETTKRLQEDIDQRGVSVQYNNGGGQTGFKKNDSMAELVKVNGQMLKILDALNIKAPEERAPTEEGPSLDLV